MSRNSINITLQQMKSQEYEMKGGESPKATAKCKMQNAYYSDAGHAKPKIIISETESRLNHAAVHRIGCIEHYKRAHIIYGMIGISYMVFTQNHVIFHKIRLYMIPHALFMRCEHFFVMYFMCAFPMSCLCTCQFHGTSIYVSTN